MEFQEQLKQKRQKVEAVVERYLPKSATYQKTVVNAMNYSVLGGGKRIRPLIMNETYYMFGGRSQVVEPFMAAMEILHTYSLVHDDLPAMDNDDYRRGRETTHVVFGEAMGILAGDGLLNYAFETASEAFEIEPNSPLVGKAMRYFAQKAGIYGMVGGQVADVENEGKELSPDLLQYIYEMKTGALLQSAMVTGAILAGATLNEQKVLEEVALDIGVAFQIQDDILDVTSTQDELGKTIGSDAKNHKTTYVSIHGLEQSQAEVARLTRQAVAKLDRLVVKNSFLRELLLYMITRRK